MTKKRVAQVGTVSSGTLRSVDLLRAFANELAWLSEPTRTTEETALIADAGDTDPDSIVAHAVIDELITALQDYAPEGFIFGAHEGDGADFGFWPIDSDEYR